MAAVLEALLDAHARVAVPPPAKRMLGLRARDVETLLLRWWRRWRRFRGVHFDAAVDLESAPLDLLAL